MEIKNTKNMVINQMVIVILPAVLLLGLFQSALFAQPYDDEYVAPVVTGQGQARPESPEVGITDEKKITLGRTETEWFLNMTGQAKDFKRIPVSYRGQNYNIFKDMQDPDGNRKQAGVQKGVQILIGRGITIPRNLNIYLMQDREPEQTPGCVDAQGKVIFVTNPENGAVSGKCKKVLTIAFKRGLRWEPVANIIIKTLKPTSPPAISGSGFKGLDKTTITTIHEIGHILHERQAGEFFWTLKGAPNSYTNPISGYGSRNKLEFVAEVFTASVIGFEDLNRFYAEYKSFRGPYSALLGMGN